MGEKEEVNVADPNTFLLAVDLLASETGYYIVENTDGSGERTHPGHSPDIHVKIGETYIFDQGAGSNWYHPIGFAYFPDGAHGEDWGGDERAEVEGLGELVYKKNGVAMDCEDAGDTGLDCYEPAFFYPRGDWKADDWSAELTITQDVADEAEKNGGVLYYFCHIHSKMSGRIIIDSIYDESKEMELYPTYTKTDADTVCGTSDLTDDFLTWKERFLCGNLESDFEKCVQSINYKMNSEMENYASAYSSGEDDPIAIFCEQMIPHHVNAVNMAKILLKHYDFDNDPYDEEHDDEWKILLFGIINNQNYQIHQFRNYLAENPSKRFCKSDFKGKFWTNDGSAWNEIKCKNISDEECEQLNVKQMCPETCNRRCRTSCTDSVTIHKQPGNSFTCLKIRREIARKPSKKKYCKKSLYKYLCPVVCDSC